MKIPPKTILIALIPLLGACNYITTYSSVTPNAYSNSSRKKSTVNILKGAHKMHFEESGDTITSAKARDIPLSDFIGYVQKKGRLHFNYKYDALKTSLISYKVDGNYTLDRPKFVRAVLEQNDLILTEKSRKTFLIETSPPLKF